jgi:hypothetical protein
MFDKTDVNGGSREQGARKHGNEFSDLAHQSPLSSKLCCTLSVPLGQSMKQISYGK